MSALMLVSCAQGGGGMTSSALQCNIISQDTLLCGVPSSMRVIVYNEAGLAPIRDAQVTATLINDRDKARTKLFSEKTDGRGTIAFTYTVPQCAEGKGTIEVVTRYGSAERKDTFPVTVGSSETRIQLTTDKPLYQPGQTVHIRALALETPLLSPMSKKTMTIEVKDGRGNKLLKKDAETSKYGIVGLDFALARELNEGEFSITAKGADSNVPEVKKAFLVKKYVLPKFKVALEAERKYYQAGETIEGFVSAKYFFGKPAANADVVINALICDERLRKTGTLKGKTDAAGFYRFRYTIPRTFSGRAYEENKAYISLEAHVTDRASHKESAYHQYTVAKYPISIKAVAEAGKLMGGLENNIYILTSYPDGTPAQCSVTVRFPEGNSREVSTDSSGFAMLPVTPKAGEDMFLQMTTRDRKGNDVSTSQRFSASAGEDAIIVRTDRPLYKNGDVVKVKLLSRKQGGTAYLDLINKGQTVWTASLELSQGQGETHFELPSGIYGTVALNAYYLSPYAGVVKNSRMLFIAPKDLDVSIKVDRDAYKPGEEATLQFVIKDRKGNPVPSAIGLDVVDESVFAMYERRAGSEKAYFLIPPALQKAPFTISDLGMRDFIASPDEPRSLSYSGYLLSQAPQTGLYAVSRDSYQEKKAAITSALEKIGTCTEDYRLKKGSYPSQMAELVKEGIVSSSALRDPWGREYLLKSDAGAGASPVQRWGAFSPNPAFAGEHKSEKVALNPTFSWQAGRPNVLCLGGDGKEGTADDLDLKSCLMAKIIEPPKDVHEKELISEQRNADGMSPALESSAMKAQSSMAAGASKDRASIAPSANLSDKKKADATEAGAAPVRTREYFPETLFSMAELITDDAGKAEVKVPLADSITTWRMNAVANSMKGDLGSASSSLKVFQDFFIDLDLPVSLTQGDEVTVPVTVYNYLPDAQNVKVTLEKAPWFEMQGKEDTQTVKVAKEDVASLHFRIKALKAGMHKITVKTSGSSLNDVISRDIEVEPDGKKYELSQSDIFSDKGAQASIDIPDGAVDGSEKLELTVYPKPIAQIVDGMDKVVRMPTGCFEQTTSALYPDVLVLQYLRKTKQSSPELEKRAQSFISQGFQRFLTFEVKGGGFSYYSAPPMSPYLSAYGLMILNDTNKVYQVDSAVMERTKSAIMACRRSDGSWPANIELPQSVRAILQRPDNRNFTTGVRLDVIQRVIANSIPSPQDLTTTAYIAWALAEAGVPQSDLNPTLAWLKGKRGEMKDPYTMALYANALLVFNQKDTDAADILNSLISSGMTDNDRTCWKDGRSLYCSGTPATIETTALVASALMKANMSPEVISKSLSYLTKAKSRNGLWHSTQATALALRALLASQDFTGNIDVNLAGDIMVNGSRADSFKVGDANRELFQSFDLTSRAVKGKNSVSIDAKGKGISAWQLSGTYYLPWSKSEVKPGKDLAIKVAYDRHEVKTQDCVRCTVDVKNLRPNPEQNVMVEVGLPPGFDVETSDLERLVSGNILNRIPEDYMISREMTGGVRSRIAPLTAMTGGVRYMPMPVSTVSVAKYEVMKGKVVLYLNTMAPKSSFAGTFRLCAKYPAKVKAPASVTYLYYNPEINDWARPVDLKVI
jgi:uncharacterized protein YfaS (alpha-2-macroglobulin family)